MDVIRQAVLDLVADRGIEGITVDAVAAVAQASKATLYRRWPTKSDLVTDAIRMSFRDAAPSDPGDLGSLRDELRTIVVAAAGMLVNKRRLLIALIDGAQRDPVVMSLMRQETREKYRGVLQRPLQRAMVRGEIDPGANLNLVSDVAFPLLLHRAMWNDPIDDAAIDSIVDDVLMKIVEPPPAR